jgi:hypothetical protein
MLLIGISEEQMLVYIFPKLMIYNSSLLLYV